MRGKEVILGNQMPILSSNQEKANKGVGWGVSENVRCVWGQKILANGAKWSPKWLLGIWARQWRAPLTWPGAYVCPSPSRPSHFCLSRHRLSITLWSRRKAEVSKFPGSSRFGDCQRCLVAGSYLHGRIPSFHYAPAPPPAHNFGAENGGLGSGVGYKGWCSMWGLRKMNPKGAVSGADSWSPTKRGVRHRICFSLYPRPLHCLASICRFAGLTQAPQRGPHGPEVGVRLGSGTESGVWDRTRRGTVRGPHRSAPEAGEALWQGLPGKMVVFREGGAAPQSRAGEPKSLGVN